MKKVRTLGGSTVGKKAIVAVTGIVLVGFVVAHLLGNLQIYLGPEAVNAYAEFLHTKPGLLWAARAVLLVSVGVHIWLTISLAARNTAARPVGYGKNTSVVPDPLARYASRTMVWSGPILAVFIIYHLLHLTFGFSPSGHEHSDTDVYMNLVNGFSVPWVSAFYILAMLMLGTHLYHGLWSLFQSLGLAHPRYNAFRRKLAAGLATFLVVGNISIPVSILMGWVQ